MKTLKIIAVGIILLVSSASHAQISVSLNIGTAPVYHNSANIAVGYYYLPDIQCYFDISANQYIYLDRGNWERSRYLPYQYRNYDAYNGYKVVLNDYRGNTPYVNYNNDRTRYYVGYRGNNQRIVEHHDNYRGAYKKNKHNGWKKHYAYHDDDHDDDDRGDYRRH